MHNHNYTSMCTKNSLSSCLLMHMNFNFIVCLMHSSEFMFQFTYLFIYLFMFSWLYLNSFRSLLPCVLPFFSCSLLFPGLNTFQPSFPSPFCNPTNVLNFQQLLLGSHVQLYLYETFQHPFTFNIIPNGSLFSFSDTFQVKENSFFYLQFLCIGIPIPL
jgi:hypothetical protein